GQFGFRVRAAARLAPGECRERWKNRARMVPLHDRIAERRLDAPQAEDDAALDTEILLDACEQRRVGFRALPSGLDPPIGDTAIEVLPELLIELGLTADFGEHRGVGLQPAHHPRVSRVGNPFCECAGAKSLDPLGKRLRGDLRESGRAERERRATAERSPEQMPTGKVHSFALPPNRGEDSAAHGYDLLCWGSLSRVMAGLGPAIPLR